jgi:hypothetical protein
MFNLFRSKKTVDPIIDSPEEHHIQLPGFEIAISKTIKTVFLIDGTGAGANPEGGKALKDLELWLKDQGYFLHGVSLSAPLPVEKPKDPELAREIEKAKNGEV